MNSKLYQVTGASHTEVASQSSPTINNKSMTHNNKPALFMRWILALLMLCTTGVYAQMSTTVTMSASPIAGSPFSSLAAAITAINGLTITGPVVATSVAGTETNPAGGYSITATGTITNTITIQGNGAATSIVTAPNPAGTAGNLNDAIFKIIGGDYITIQGFAMNENGANTTTAAATNNMVEWGVALLYASTTNGAQNCTIQNNSITLNRTYQNTFGIYSNSTHSATSISTSATATSTAGGNSGLKIYGNIITNVNQGIVVIGPTAAADMNAGLDIGGTSAPQGNTITNWGTTNAISSYNLLSGQVHGMFIRNVLNYNISYNTLISSNGGITVGQLRGIWVNQASNTPTGSQVNTITNNNISLKSAATTAITSINVDVTTASATSSISINNNDFNNTTHTVASSAAVNLIADALVCATTNINGNTFTNLSINTTGSVVFVANAIAVPAIGNTQTISNNTIVTGFSKTGAGGTVTFFTSNASSVTGSIINFQNNNLSNITLTGATGFVGINNTDGGAPTKTITGNTFNNISGGTGSINPMTVNFMGGTTCSVSSNTFTNISWGASITALSIGSSNSASTFNLNNNTVNNITSPAGAVTGITCAASATTTNINNNSVSALSSTAASAIIGIAVAGGAIVNVSKNTICDLSGNNASTTVNGMLVSSGTTVTLSNNRVGVLNATVANAANPLIGINITGGTTVNAYFNTVDMSSTSSGPLFGSSAVSVSTTPTVTFNNNIFSNTSTPNGAGLSVAYRRSSATLSTYGSASDRNDFLASTVYTDGVTPQVTIGSYKTLVGPTRDANSIAVVAPFLSTTCGNPNFLKINTATATQIESGGAPVGGITDDFEGDARNGSTPDIGADEFNGTPAAVCGGTPAASTITGANSVCTGSGTTLSLSTIYTDLGILYQWRSSITPGGPYSTTLGTSATQATGNLTSTTYYIAEITCTNSGLTYTTAEKTVTVNALPTVGVSPSSSSFCTPGGTAVTLTASGASTYTWSPTAGLTPTTGSPVAASPASTTTYTVTGTDGNGCVNTATALVTVSSNPQSVVATATPANICSGSTSSLSVTASIPFTAKQYLFSASTSATLNGMVGATTVVSSSTDDAPMNTSVGANTTAGNSVPIGFTFNYEGTAYTHFSASPDGWIKLGTTTAAAVAEFTNAMTSPTTAPRITPYWDDLATGTTGNVKTLVTGTAPNRIFIVQWFVTIPRAVSGAANSTFQAWLYETSGLIEFRYGTMGTPTSGSISGGLTGATATNFNSLTFSSNTSSNSSANDANAVAPVSGTIYSYASPVSFTYAWAPSGDVVSPTSQTTLTNALTATETFTVTVSNGGCSATATTTVTVSPLTAGSITTTGSLCANTNFTATANTTGGSPVYNYTWSDGVGGVYPNAQTVTVNKPAGSYTLSVTVMDGCGGSVPMSLPITVNALPTVTITPTPGTARICGTGSVSLAAAGATTYAWLPVTNLTPTTGSPVTANPTTTTTYTVSGTDANGCVNTAAQTVTYGSAITVATPTATPVAICSGGTSVLNASASASPALNYSVASIAYAAQTPSGTPVVLCAGGTNNVTTDFANSASNLTGLDDAYWNNIALPFAFNFYGVSNTTIRIATNGNVQFGTAVAGTGSGTSVSWVPQTIPTAGGNLDNYIGLPWMDHDPSTSPYGTIQYFTNGVAPNRQFIISFESVKVYNITDLNTAQIILNENGNTVEIHLGGGGLAASTVNKTMGIEGPGGTLGTAAPGRNFGLWSTAANEAWLFTPATLNYTWTPATGLTPSASVSNPTTPALTSTTTYTVTATEPISGCSATGNVIVTIGTANITATAGTGGSISPNGLTTINCGLNQAYTITADPCYTIADVVVDGVSQGAVSSYTFTAVTAGAHTITASFTLTTYTITVTAGANGSITPGTGSVNCGSNPTYTITANACYSIADVLVDGVSVGAVGTYTFSTVTGNHTISASFVQNTYTITVTAGANGSITPGTGSVNCGANATYTITANACYSIADVLVDGVSVGAVGTYTFSTVTGNHTISASFVQNTYTITVTAGANGSITPGTGSVNCGSNATYTITANACYSIADVVVDGVSQGAVGTYTFTNVITNHTISATFVLNTYTITVTAGANGSITPGTGSVNCGDNATYTITPNACYAIADVVVDGVSQGAVGTYTFTNVTFSHTISATFLATTYTITVTAGANGSITPATGSVICGANATYTITANACYSIADVVVDGVSQGAVGTYTFTNVTAAHTISASFVLNTYTITVTPGANGTITPGTGTVNCGSNATYTITANGGYTITDVIVDGVSQGAVGTYTFTNVTATHTISATFAINAGFTITSSAGANGSISPNGATAVTSGANQSYTISPSGGYSIANVLVDGISVGAVPTYTFTNVTANHTISATFTIITYTITASAGTHGTIAPNGVTVVNSGANQVYTITPATGYHVAGVLVDGISVGAVTTYTFTNVTANHTISATFAINTYTITATSGANGSVTPTGVTIVNSGTNKTYTITANGGYSISNVLVDGTPVGAVASYTFTNVTANHTISATFAINTYSITASAGANGSIAPNGVTIVNGGTNQAYTITANAGYSIANVLVDGTPVGAVANYTFANVTSNHTISATFTINTYTITASAGVNGTIAPNGITTLNSGSGQAYTITPNAGYSIADVLVDGVSVGAVSNYTFTNVTSNRTISATFTINTYTITASAGVNGSIAPNGITTVNSGSGQAYTITPNAGYSIANVLVDGGSVGAVSNYTFTNVTGNHTITATFTINTYSITASAGANGSIAPNGVTIVNSGSNKVYTITANAGYSIADVLVDGNTVGAVGTYTFTNVTANHTISASFVLSATYTITSSAVANGSISPNGVTVLSSGANQSYTITADACYHIADVLVDGNSVGAVASYSFTNVTANHTISASFILNPPLTAPVVTGPVNVCPYIGTGTLLTYSVPAVTGAISYNWTVPASVTIVSGQGTSNLVVAIGNNFFSVVNKQIRISVATTCGTTPLTVFVLTAQAPNTPQPITGPTSVCPVIGTAGTFTYSVPPVVGATSYIWTAQSGTTTITHPNGAGVNDTTVNVSFTNGFSSSSITVRAANDSCGASNVRSLALVRANPSTPGLINGPTNACAYIAPGGVPATYFVTAVAGQTYNWTVPAGAGGLTGQGTASISFTYPAGFVSGTISVTTTNGCGTSPARSLSINKLNPAIPGVIDVIQTDPCPNRVFTYTLPATPSNSTSVQWTVPSGATLVSGQGSISITVSYPGTSLNDIVTAQSFSNCGSSNVRSTPVHLPVCADDGRNTYTKGSGTSTTAPAAEAMKVNVYPNPTVSDFKLQVVTAGKQTITVRILDAQGRSFKTFEIMPYQTINVGSDLKAGAYMMEVRQGNEVKVTKLLKF